MAVTKSGYMLEQLCISMYRGGENHMSVVNQQERLSVQEAKKWYLAGCIEGEGSLCVSMKTHESSKFGFLVDPEFFLYQHYSGVKMLNLAQEIFGTGSIRPKVGNEDVLVFSIVSRKSLYERVIPFYEKYMCFSAKWEIFLRFKEIVIAMEERKEHRTPHGLVELVKKAYQMNPASKGKERKRPLNEVIDRILRGHTPDTKNLIIPCDDMVRSQ
jgi:LAGLIDADG endonuclease